MLTFFRSKSNPSKIAAEKLYFGLIAQSRTPVFYAEWGVPDTVDGRFDMILLHNFIIMRRLVGQGKAAEAVSQALYDTMFVDMDRALREIGVGDLSVGRHIRRMMKALNGRFDAYEKGLADPEVLGDAIRRNVYGTITGEVSTTMMSNYLRTCVAAVQAMPVQSIIEGNVIWPFLGQLQQSA